MENQTSPVSYELEYYYYYDYIDPVIVDERKLKYNKYTIVIVFWIVLAASVGLLFFTLNLMSWGGKSPVSPRSKTKGTRTTS